MLPVPATSLTKSHTYPVLHSKVYDLTPSIDVEPTSPHLTFNEFQLLVLEVDRLQKALETNPTPTILLQLIDYLHQGANKGAFNTMKSLDQIIGYAALAENLPLSKETLEIFSRIAGAYFIRDKNSLENLNRSIYFYGKIEAIYEENNVDCIRRALNLVDLSKSLDERAQEGDPALIIENCTLAESLFMIFENHLSEKQKIARALCLYFLSKAFKERHDPAYSPYVLQYTSAAEDIFEETEEEILSPKCIKRGQNLSLCVEALMQRDDPADKNRILDYSGLAESIFADHAKKLSSKENISRACNLVHYNRLLLEKLSPLKSVEKSQFDLIIERCLFALKIFSSELLYLSTGDKLCYASCYRLLAEVYFEKGEGYRIILDCCENAEQAFLALGELSPLGKMERALNLHLESSLLFEKNILQNEGEKEDSSLICKYSSLAEGIFHITNDLSYKMRLTRAENLVYWNWALMQQEKSSVPALARHFEKIIKQAKRAEQLFSELDTINGLSDIEQFLRWINLGMLGVTIFKRNNLSQKFSFGMNEEAVSCLEKAKKIFRIIDQNRGLSSGQENSHFMGFVFNQYARDLNMLSDLMEIQAGGSEIKPQDYAKLIREIDTNKALAKKLLEKLKDFVPHDGGLKWCDLSSLVSAASS